MLSKTCECKNNNLTISQEGITRRFQAGNEHVLCLSKTAANDIAEGSIIAAATYVGSLGGGLTAALLVQLTGWAIRKYGIGNIPAFCVSYKITIPQVPWWMAGFAPPPTVDFHTIWEQ